MSAVICGDYGGVFGLEHLRTEGVAEFAGSIVEDYRGGGGGAPLHSDLLNIIQAPLVLCLGRSGADPGGTLGCSEQTEMV